MLGGNSGVSLLLLLAAVGLVSCDSEEVWDIPLPAEHQPMSEAVSLPVDVYYDATPSMAGYLVDPTYRKLVSQDLGNAGFVGEEVRFFKATTDISSLVQEIGSPMEAGLPEFYARGDTRLDAILDSASTRHLTCVVTDLFQTDNDLNKVSKVVTDRFLKAQLSVGIVAVRYQFSGTVYDVASSDNSFSFLGNRPVYLLAFGPYQGIKGYFDRLKTFMSNTDRVHLLILSPRWGNPPSRFHSISSTTNVQEKTLLRHARADVKQLRIMDSDREGQFEVSVQTFPLDYVVPLSEVEWVSEWDKDLTAAFDVDQEGFENSTGLFEAVSVSASLELPVVRLKVTTHPALLRHSTIYRYTLKIYPKDIPLPRWIDEWDMPLVLADAWRNPSASFNGTTTLNLKTFLLRIQRDIVELNNPLLAEVHFILKNEGD